MKVTEAIRRAEGNSRCYGGKWRVVKNGSRLWIQPLASSMPDGYEVLYVTGDSDVHSKQETLHGDSTEAGDS